MKEKTTSCGKLLQRVELEKPLHCGLALILILAAAFLVFSNTLSHDFVYNWDDDINVTNNPHIRDLSKQGIINLFGKSRVIHEPRLTLLTYAIEFRIWGLDPFPFHLNNILLHLVNVILVFFFARYFLKKNALSLLAALIFAVHPMHVESVAWITGRKDLLFTFFVLSSLLAYIRYIRKGENPIFFLLAAGLGFLAVLSKIQALSLPVIWIMLDVYYRRDFRPLLLAEKLFPLLLLFWNLFFLKQVLLFALVYLLIRRQENLFNLRLFKKAGAWLQRKMPLWGHILWSFMLAVVFFFILKKINQNTGAGFDARAALLSLAESLLMSAAYLVYLFRQGNLAGKRIMKFTPLHAAFVAVVLLIIAVILLYPLMKFWTPDFKLEFSMFDRFFMAAYSLSYYLAGFVYPLGTSPIHPYPDISTGFPLMYYLSAGFLLVLFAVVLIFLVKKKMETRPALVFGLLFFLANIGLVLHFFSIEGRVIVADRYAYLAYLGLIMAAIIIGDHYHKKMRITVRKVMRVIVAAVLILFCVITFQKNQVWKNGIILFTEVIRHYPEFELAYSNRGTLYLNMGPAHYQQAIADFDKALELKPGFDVPLYNKGLIAHNLGQYDTAFVYAQRVLDVNPGFYDAWLLRGFVKNKRGEFASAVADYDMAISLHPNHQFAFYNRANAKKNAGDYHGAIADYRQTLSLDPDHANAYNGLGVAYYFLYDYDKSVACYNLAIQKLTDPRAGGDFYFNRALSKLKLGWKDQACSDLFMSLERSYSPAQEVYNEHCR